MENTNIIRYDNIYEEERKIKEPVETDGVLAKIDTLNKEVDDYPSVEEGTARGDVKRHLKHCEKFLKMESRVREFRLTETKKLPEIKRGDVWWCQLDHATVESELREPHCVVVVSKENGRLCTVAPITHARRIASTTPRNQTKLPHIALRTPLEVNNELFSEVAYVHIADIRSVSRVRLTEKVGYLKERDMNAINHALRWLMDLEDESQNRISNLESRKTEMYHEAENIVEQVSTLFYGFIEPNIDEELLEECRKIFDDINEKYYNIKQL